MWEVPNSTISGAETNAALHWEEKARRIGERITGSVLPAAPEPHHPNEGETALTGYWFRARGQRPKAVLVCLHGIQTHAAWFAGLAEELTPRGYTLLCPNRRGSGGSTNVRRDVNDIGHWETWVNDLDVVMALARKEKVPVVLVGTSWGAKPALAWLGRHPDGADAAVLLVPAIYTQKEGWRNRLAVGICGRLPLLAGLALQPVKPRDYLPKNRPSDPDLEKAIQTDPKMNHRATFRMLFEAGKMNGRAIAAAPEVSKRTHVLIACEDRIVDNPRVEALFPRSVHFLPREGHAVQIENPRAIAHEIDTWLGKQLRGRAP